jgi:hypothetical protein
MADLFIGGLPGKLRVCSSFAGAGAWRDGAIIGGVSQWLLREERGVYGLFLWFCFCFRWIPFSFWFISTAPVRGGSHFLCCCKESNQRKQLDMPAVTRSLATLASRSWAL